MKNVALTTIAAAVLGLSGCKKDPAKGTPAPGPESGKVDPGKVDPGKVDPGPTTPDPAPAPAPAVFTSAEGGYSINFGGTPSEQVHTEQTPVGQLDIHLAALDMGDQAFLVSWQEQPPKAPKDPNTILDGQLEGMLSGFPGARVVEQKEIKLGDHVGRSHTIKLAEPDATQFTRVYLVGNRVYQIAAIGAGAGNVTSAMAFLDSFALTAK